MVDSSPVQVSVKVVGVGGAGGNAVLRMSKGDLQGVETLAINTDVQALALMKKVPTFAIGPETTGGMGCGGRHELGRKAVRESQDQLAQLLAGQDLVFVAAGMGGGTGTGGAPVLAEIARRQKALTVGVVTLPFSFEGPQRRAVALDGLRQLEDKVDTLIVVENDRLLPAVERRMSVERAFELADDALRHGVQGISELIMVPGLINVDFADVRSVMSSKGRAFMGMGRGSGKWAATEAASAALSNPLFDTPLEGASGVLLNVRGGKDLTLGQVHEAAAVVRKATRSDANMIFGVVQDRRLKGKVNVTLVATGLSDGAREPVEAKADEAPPPGSGLREQPAASSYPVNGHQADPAAAAGRLL